VWFRSLKTSTQLSLSQHLHFTCSFNKLGRNPIITYLILVHILHYQNRGGSVSAVTRLGAGRPGLDSRQEQARFSHRHRVQASFGAHPTSYPMGTGALSPGVKRLGREADHSPLSSVEHGTIPPLPHTSSWRGTRLNTGSTLAFTFLP